jgi:hypothetical protein
MFRALYRQIIRIYICFHVWLRRCKMYAFQTSVSRARPGEKKGPISFSYVFQNSYSSKFVHPPTPALYIHAVTDWLNFKFRYFPIGTKLKILKTLSPLAPIHVMLLAVLRPCELRQASCWFLVTFWRRNYFF